MLSSKNQSDNSPSPATQQLLLNAFTLLARIRTLQYLRVAMKSVDDINKSTDHIGQMHRLFQIFLDWQQPRNNYLYDLFGEKARDFFDSFKLELIGKLRENFSDLRKELLEVYSVYPMKEIPESHSASAAVNLLCEYDTDQKPLDTARGLTESQAQERIQTIYSKIKEGLKALEEIDETRKILPGTAKAKRFNTFYLTTANLPTVTAGQTPWGFYLAQLDLQREELQGQIQTLASAPPITMQQVPTKRIKPIVEQDDAENSAEMSNVTDDDASVEGSRGQDGKRKLKISKANRTATFQVGRKPAETPLVTDEPTETSSLLGSSRHRAVETGQKLTTIESTGNSLPCAIIWTWLITFTLGAAIFAVEHYKFRRIANHDINEQDLGIALVMACLSVAGNASFALVGKQRKLHTYSDGSTAIVKHRHRGKIIAGSIGSGVTQTLATVGFWWNRQFNNGKTSLIPDVPAQYIHAATLGMYVLAVVADTLLIPLMLPGLLKQTSRPQQGAGNAAEVAPFAIVHSSSQIEQAQLGEHFLLIDADLLDGSIEQTIQDNIDLHEGITIAIFSNSVLDAGTRVDLEQATNVVGNNIFDPNNTISMGDEAFNALPVAVKASHLLGERAGQGSIIEICTLDHINSKFAPTDQYRITEPKINDAAALEEHLLEQFKFSATPSNTF